MPALDVSLRIIPTRVGTSDFYSSFNSSLQDHPHACGDKVVLYVVVSVKLGSSPRVWGQAQLFIFPVKPPGIIPTRVGTRMLHDQFAEYYEDHPHACGDKLFPTQIHTQYVGSSPRVWGQVVFQNLRAFVYRIIPTRVGTRWAVLLGRLITREHPHACGDKVASQGQYGTSDRIIPTRVGTSIIPTAEMP